MKGATVRSLAPRGSGALAREIERRAAEPPRLGRGVVTAVSGSTVTLALAGGGEVDATLALALPYDACVGDVLLVIGEPAAGPGEGGEAFVIGVLSGRGKTRLELQGHVALHAVGGVLDLSGDEGVQIRGPVVEVQTDTLHTVARSVVSTFASLFQRVTEILHVHAHQQVTIVDEGAYTQAKTAAIQTENVVTINGKEVHLG
jgi:hypothetical protein